MDPNCCCLDCPPNSTAKLVPNPDGPGPDVCKCVCDSYPPECNDKEYLKTDPFGKAMVWLSPRDPLVPCSGIIPARDYEFTGEPCSCLCKDIKYHEACSHLPKGVPRIGSNGYPSFPYTGKIDPRKCDCEMLCSAGCDPVIPNQNTIDLILSQAGPGSQITLHGLPDGATFNNCRVPGMCCKPKVPTPEAGYNVGECSGFCDPEGKTQCCSIRLDHIGPFRRMKNLTFCCKECEECVDTQTFNARCKPIPGCVPSQLSPPSPQSINIESL